MCGNAVGTGLSREEGRPHRVRMRNAARITDRRHVIDINA
jgi:hypothetical protein